MQIRRMIQSYFLALYLLAGYLFHLLVNSTLGGASADFSLRFPVIETFLPLSAMVGLKQLIATGVFDQIHPAGLAILLLAIVSALLLRRGVCSHICPLGTLSEVLEQHRNNLIPFRISLPRLVHYLFMLPKYALLLFFLQAILAEMSGADAAAFTHSAYNIIVDAKMLLFFENPSALTVEVMVGLVALTIVIPFFWCRYLCPYGALLNLAAAFSPLELRRQQNRCDSCGICDRQCPSHLRISESVTVISPECTYCHRCTTACPTKALSLYNRLTGRALQPAHYSLALVVLFTSGILVFKLSGHWNSAILPVLWAKYLPLVTIISHP